jgi:hypothetical protein
VVHQTFFMARTTLAASLLIILATGSSAQVSGPASNEYSKAIHTAILRQWEPDSYSSELKPSSSCAARIVQMPGGDILSVDFFPDCEFNSGGRAAIVDAVHRSAPLPYSGFESDYQREIRIVFHAASVGDRQGLVAAQAAAERVKKDSAESDRHWEATVGSRRRQDEYTKQCSFHLLSEMPKVQLQHPTAVVVTVDKAGKVVGVAGIKGEPIDEQLSAALSATRPCEPIPADLVVGAGTVKVGPILVRNRGD